MNIIKYIIPSLEIVSEIKELDVVIQLAQNLFYLTYKLSNEESHMYIFPLIKKLTSLKESKVNLALIENIDILAHQIGAE